MKRAAAPLACFAAGAAAVWGFAPARWFVLPFAALAILAALTARAPGGAAAFGRGFCFGVGLFGIGIFWLTRTLQIFAAMPFAAAFAVLCLFVAVLSLFPALACAAFRRFDRGDGKGAARALLFAGCWTLLEWARATAGFGWLQIGYSQTPPSPLAHYAAFGGVLLATFFVALTAGFAAFAARRESILAAAAVLAAGLLGGAIPQTRAEGEVEVALLQSNIELPWDLAGVDLAGLATRLIDLAAEANAAGTFIVAPETALPADFGRMPDDWQARFEAVAPTDGALILGAFASDDDGRDYNAAIALGDFDSATYRKHRIVPFGEFLPFAAVLSPLYAALGIPPTGLSAGGAGQLLRLPGAVFGASVCFDELFGDAWRAQWREAEVLLNLTNDSWYTRRMIGQHLQIAQFRAVESGRYLARATTTGRTAVIDSRGVIEAQLPLNEAGILRRKIPKMRGATVYTRVGDWLAFIIALTAAGGAAWWLRLRLRQMQP